MGGDQAAASMPRGVRENTLRDVKIEGLIPAPLHLNTKQRHE